MVGTSDTSRKNLDVDMARTATPRTELCGTTRRARRWDKDETTQALGQHGSVSSINPGRCAEGLRRQ